MRVAVRGRGRETVAIGKGAGRLISGESDKGQDCGTAAFEERMVVKGTERVGKGNRTMDGKGDREGGKGNKDGKGDREGGKNYIKMERGTKMERTQGGWKGL